MLGSLGRHAMSYGRLVKIKEVILKITVHTVSLKMCLAFLMEGKKKKYRPKQSVALSRDRPVSMLRAGGGGGELAFSGFAAGSGYKLPGRFWKVTWKNVLNVPKCPSL